MDLPRGAGQGLLALGLLGNAQHVEIPLPEGATARLGLGQFYAVAYSPDGIVIAVATSLGVELRRSESLALVEFLVGHTDDVVSVAFAPDGRTVASGSLDGTVKLQDTS